MSDAELVSKRCARRNRGFGGGGVDWRPRLPWQTRPLPRRGLARGLFSLLALSLALVALSAPLPSAQTQAAEAAAGGSRPAALLGRTGRPLPRFVSLRAGEVNLRSGPGLRYPIEWVYTRRGLPVEIIDEFDTWRRIRDWEGTEGWVHQSMLQGQRTLRVIGETRPLRSERSEGAPALALVEPGALGAIESCEGVWCRVVFGEFGGWLKRSEFFGSYPHESFD